MIRTFEGQSNRVLSGGESDIFLNFSQLHLGNKEINYAKS